VSEGRRSFWEAQCPERGPTLTHTHSRNCKDGHSPSQCCDCGLTAVEWHNLMDRLEREEKARPRQANVDAGACLAFAFTLSGRCSNCGQVEDDHPLLLAKAGRGCGVDHGSIFPKRLIGDGGEEMSRCPSCNVQVEGRAVTGDGPQGSPDEKGRGHIGFRLGNRLKAIRFRVERGDLGGPRGGA